MNSSLKQVEAVIKLSAIFRRSAWRSNKTLSELNAGLGGESFNPSQAILHNQDEGKDSHVSMDESSMLADETYNPSWSELVMKLRAERINRPQIAFSNEDEDDSFMGIDESSTVANETYVSSWSEEVAKLRAKKTNRPQIAFYNEHEDEDSFMDSEDEDTLFMDTVEGSMAADETSTSSWSEEVAKLRAEKINRPKIILSDDDEGENNIESIDESTMEVDEAHTTSSSSFVSEKFSKFKRPSSVRLTDVNGNANKVSLIGSICNRVQLKWTASGERLVWTSIDMRDANFCISDRLQLYFSNELAGIAKQHLKIGDFVYVSGKLEQKHHKIWIKAEELKFVQQPVTRNTE